MLLYSATSKKKEEGARERENVMSDILSMSNNTVSPSLFTCGPVFKTTSSLTKEIKSYK